MGRIYKVGDFIEVEELGPVEQEPKQTPNGQQEQPEQIKESEEIVIDSNRFKGQEIKYYQQNLQKKTVHNPVIGDVYLGKEGRDETKVKGPKKYMSILCYIDKLIETGECDGKIEPPKHPRNDSITGFYIIYNDVIYDEVKLRVKITICIRSNGFKYYLFNAKMNEDLPMSTADRNINSVCRVEQVHDIIINDKKKNVNLSIKDLNEVLQKYIEE